MKTILKVFSFIIIIDTVVFCLFRYWVFMRDPKRKAPPGRNVVSPADGKIIYIREIKENKVPLSIKKGRKFDLSVLYPEITNKFKHIIGIYMSELSVHFNRAPIAGLIRDSIVKEGPNFSMIRLMMNIIFRLRPFEQKCSFYSVNTRRLTIIEGDICVAIVQIADKWVNRIDLYKSIGQAVEKGEKIGMIRMGSQCDILLPDIKGLNITVKEGEWVKAGCDILAELP